MPIRIHESQLTSLKLREKLGITKRALPRELERPEQVSAVARIKLLERRYPALKRLFFAVPNGGQRDKRVARKLVAEGVKAGVSDLLFLASRRGYHYLAIEVKYGRNKPSPDQSAFLSDAINEDGCAALCYSGDAVVAVVEWYLGVTEQRPDCILC